MTRELRLSRFARLTTALCVVIAAFARAEPPATRPALSPAVVDACYRPDDPDPAVRAACTLDVYAAANGKPTAVLVWFHGGGLMGGDKREAAALARVLTPLGVAVVGVDYRLSPASKYPTYVQDAAAAFAWAVAHADTLGVTQDRVFVGGYSAGGYLACTLACDERWLKAVGLSKADIKGVVAISPQVFTHYAIRRERGVPDWEWTPLIDDAAPVYHAAKDLPPMRLFCGDHDTPTRREEIEYFVSVLGHKGNTTTELTVIPGRNHGTMYGKIDQQNDPVARGVEAFLAR